MKRVLRRFRIGAAAAAWAVSLCLVTAAGAQGRAAVEYDLPAQALEASLKALAEQQKLQMLYVQADVEGKSASALKGRFTVAEALNLLTRGTGLTASFDGKETVVIKPPAPPASGASSASREENPGRGIRLVRAEQADAVPAPGEGRASAAYP